MIKKALLKSLLSFLVIFSMLMVTFCSFDIYKAAEMVEYPSDGISVKYAYSQNSGAYVNGNSIVLDNAVKYTSRLIFSLDSGFITGDSDVSFSFKYVLNKPDDCVLKVLQVYIYDENYTMLRKIPGTDGLISFSQNLDDGSFSFSLSTVAINSARNVNMKYIQVFIDNDVSFFPSRFEVSDISLNYYTPDVSEIIITPTPEDQENVEGSNSEMEENSSQMDSMIDDMNSMDKPDSDDLINNIDTYIPLDDIDVFSAVLSTLFENEIVISYLMIVLVVALVSFVLFGKKG